MPLLDHFHPPLFPRRGWEGFHAAWIGYISESLNRLLPAGYFAEEQTHAGTNAEIDVATFEGDRLSGGEAPAAPADDAGAVAVATRTWAAVAPTATVPAAFADDFEVRVFTTRFGGLTLVAAVELVSPANKDRPEARRAFAAKCASYLAQSVAVLVIDIVTERHANLHHEVIDLFRETPAAARLPGDPPLYTVAYRPVRRDGRDEVDVWAEPLAVGAALPVLPLWLTAVEYVSVDLDATYTHTCVRRRIAG